MAANGIDSKAASDAGGGVSGLSRSVAHSSASSARGDADGGAGVSSEGSEDPFSKIAGRHRNKPGHVNWRTNGSGSAAGGNDWQRVVDQVTGRSPSKQPTRKDSDRDSESLCPSDGGYYQQLADDPEMEKLRKQLKACKQQLLGLLNAKTKAHKTERECKQLKAELQKVRAASARETEAGQKKLNHANEERKKSDQRMKKLSSQLKQAKGESASGKRKVEAQKRQIRALEKRVERLRQEVASANAHAQTADEAREEAARLREETAQLRDKAARDAVKGGARDQITQKKLETVRALLSDAQRRNAQLQKGNRTLERAVAAAKQQIKEAGVREDTAARKREEAQAEIEAGKLAASEALRRAKAREAAADRAIAGFEALKTAVATLRESLHEERRSRSGEVSRLLDERDRAANQAASLREEVGKLKSALVAAHAMAAHVRPWSAQPQPVGPPRFIPALGGPPPQLPGVQGFAPQARQPTAQPGAHDAFAAHAAEVDRLRPMLERWDAQWAAARPATRRNSAPRASSASPRPRRRKASPRGRKAADARDSEPAQDLQVTLLV